MKSGILIGVLTVAGCATDAAGVSDLHDRQYRRENTRIEAREAFEERRRACALAGRVLVVRRASSGRLAPTVGEMKMAGC